MSTEPPTELDVAICTLLSFVDLTHGEVARFCVVETTRVERAIPRLVRSGHLIHSPTEAFAFRGTDYWDPDAPEDDGTPAGPGSPKRRHDDYRDRMSPFFRDPDWWQIANGAQV